MLLDQFAGVLGLLLEGPQNDVGFGVVARILDRMKRPALLGGGEGLREKGDLVVLVV